ncbi:MAG: hypothetical protein M1831_006836 [Alyxoria varia]|nr:MAG: hypothetical protein M1831_006836 [Alyxoria varia]
MFGLSAVGGAVAIWKTTKFPAISQPDADVTYVSAAPIYATIIEADVIIIAACIPTISPVTRMLRGKADALGSKLRDMSFSSYHQFDAGGAGAKSSTQAYASGNPTSDHTFQSHELPQLENGKAVLPNRERQTARMPEVEVLAETVVDVQRSPL